jgi:hypothetical protein
MFKQAVPFLAPKRNALAVSIAASLTFLASDLVHADLVIAPAIQVQGSGLGAVNTLVTASDNGNGPNANGTESGCVSSTGGAAFNFSCLNGLEGGDNQAINQTRLLSTVSSTDASDIALVVNLAETGQDLTVTLTDLYLSFYNLGGTLLQTFSYTGPDVNLMQGTGTGIGGSGFVFVLDAAQQLLANAACPVLSNCYAGGGFQFLNGATNNGPETLYITSVAGGGGPPDEIAEPGTLALFAVGLVGALTLRRRREQLAAAEGSST